MTTIRGSEAVAIGMQDSSAVFVTIHNNKTAIFFKIEGLRVVCSFQRSFQEHWFFDLDEFLADCRYEESQHDSISQVKRVDK